MLRVLRIVAIALVSLALLVGAALWWADRPRPEATSGPEADALARSLKAAVGGEAWEATGAVSWDFAGRHRLLWDRKRSLVEVRWDDLRVQRHVGSARGALAWREEEPLTGEPRREAVDKAYALWANDSFWLNPLEKLFDEGVTRGLWTGPSGERGLYVHYAEGGVTPGDGYLWLVGDDGLPRAWRMWVQIVPIGGLEVSWEGWKTLSTGARVSTLHRAVVMDLRLNDVRAASTLAELTGGSDPFARLVGASHPQR